METLLDPDRSPWILMIASLSLPLRNASPKVAEPVEGVCRSVGLSQLTSKAVSSPASSPPFGASGSCSHGAFEAFGVFTWWVFFRFLVY
ncbi:hypothetical protein FF1_022365 [Malus domestica]